MTRGFAAIGEPNVAVCLLPGTEIAFENEVEYERFFVLLPNIKLGTKVARFRQINVGRPMVHHDALEFPDGETVLLTRMCEGQHATVLQLPASGRPVNAAEGQKRDSLVRAGDCPVCGGLWRHSLSKSLPSGTSARATPGNTH
jgi:hypothetical protein